MPGNKTRPEISDIESGELWLLLSTHSFGDFVADIRSLEPGKKYRISDIVEHSELSESLIRGDKYHQTAADIGLLETDGTWWWLNESSEVSMLLDILDSVIKDQVAQTEVDDAA